MALHHVIGAEDRAAFLDCRRRWDFFARERGNHEPVRSVQPVDLDRAVRDALAVYYFPGMWDWQPTIVLPLVRKAFTDSVTAQRTRYLTTHELTALPPELARTAADHADLGLATLEAYLGWAPTVDELAPIQVLAELEVQVPDPRAADRELAVGSRAVRYRDRADMLAMDEDNRYWFVEHRLVHGPWPEPDAVLRDDRCLTWCWAWEHDNPGFHVQGTIYNELQVGETDMLEPPPGPRSTVAQNRTVGSWVGEPGDSVDEYDLRIRYGEGFRRIHVPRRPAEIAACGARLAAQLIEMIDEETPAYANPSTARCTDCAFRAPCLTLDNGRDVDELLAASYRPREHDAKGGTLGARTWSLGRGAAPPRL